MLKEYFFLLQNQVPIEVEHILIPGQLLDKISRKSLDHTKYFSHSKIFEWTQEIKFQQRPFFKKHKISQNNAERICFLLQNQVTIEVEPILIPGQLLERQLIILSILAI